MYVLTYMYMYILIARAFSEYILIYLAFIVLTSSSARPLLYIQTYIQTY